jgi:hypothetical protein
VDYGHTAYYTGDAGDGEGEVKYLKRKKIKISTKIFI